MGFVGAVIMVTYIMGDIPNDVLLLEGMKNIGINTDIDIDTTTNNIILVLGSNEKYMLKDRMTTAISMTKNMTGSITWFLSGGVKNDNGKHMYEESESTKMLALLDNNKKEKIVLDNKSRNTAENFAHFKYWLNTNDDKYTHLTIVTSAFHYSRANTMFNEMIDSGDMEVKWGLGPLSCISCWADETHHKRNISKDVNKAMLIYNTKMNYIRNDI
jgi:uncharacterized SAM-binding protein YcdF (DUF218 family)